MGHFVPLIKRRSPSISKFQFHHLVIRFIFSMLKCVSIIRRGECFGLLGKNGAGKSSIFKMLTGETMITDGEIYTHGYNQKYELSKIYNMIGYCPQFDALLAGLTCRETLEIFAMIRGVSPGCIKPYVEYYARQLDFIQHIEKTALQLSGGNKRKLSTALALIGNLNVVFLGKQMVSKCNFYLSLQLSVCLLCFVSLLQMNHQLAWIRPQNATYGISLFDCVTRANQLC